MVDLGCYTCTPKIMKIKMKIKSEMKTKMKIKSEMETKMIIVSRIVRNCSAVHFKQNVYVHLVRLFGRKVCWNWVSGSIPSTEGKTHQTE